LVDSPQRLRFRSDGAVGFDFDDDIGREAREEFLERALLEQRLPAREHQPPTRGSVDELRHMGDRLFANFVFVTIALEVPSVLGVAPYAVQVALR
jgi:hypothetical protein